MMLHSEKTIFQPRPMIQNLISNEIRKDHPYYNIPLPHEDLWTFCQRDEFDAHEGDRFLIRRDYDEYRNTWIVRDYILTKAPDTIYGGWARQIVVYYITEDHPYPIEKIRLCQPISLSTYIPPSEKVYTMKDWSTVVYSVLINSGAL